jgi:hypothetical protein
MLKDNATKELIWSIDREFGAVDVLVLVLVFFGATILSNALPGGWPYLGLLVLIGLSKIISFVMLYFLIAWLGRMGWFDTTLAISDTQHAEKHAMRFLESWWRYEWSIKAFIVVFRAAFCLGVYQFLVSPTVAE